VLEDAADDPDAIPAAADDDIVAPLSPAPMDIK
jgi:hypothetical protein